MRTARCCLRGRLLDNAQLLVGDLVKESPSDIQIPIAAQRGYVQMLLMQCVLF